VNSNETPDTNAWFEWGISGRSEVYETPHRGVGSGAQLSDFSEGVYGLAPNVQYFYRLVSESSRGRDVGITTYFTTKQLSDPIDPAVIVQTKTAIGIEEKEAKLRGYVAPHEGKNVRWWFEWGAAGRLENTTPTNGWGSDSGIAETRISNLTPGTLYVYRIAAENSQGIVYGNTLSFTTHGIAPAPSETARAQSVPVPQKGSTPAGSGNGSSAPGVTYSSSPLGTSQLATNNNNNVSGFNYQFTPPTFSFASLFGGNKSATNNAPSGSSANASGAPSGSVAQNPAATEVAAAGASTPLGAFWNSLTGKKVAEVTVEKFGPKSVPAHTPIEYKVTYAYRKSSPSTAAKLKIILPSTVVYIGDNTNNELLLEEGTGPERTYVLPIGRLEAGSTRTISILGMTTADANGAFPEARARLEYDNGTGIEVASSGAASVAGAKSASVASSDSSDLSFSLLPSSFFGWVLYVVLITLAIFSARKIRAYYLARKEAILLEQEAVRREREGSSQNAVPA
jgi:hypothetical protein